jgi:hypothetical protein
MRDGNPYLKYKEMWVPTYTINTEQLMKQSLPPFLFLKFFGHIYLQIVQLIAII